MRSFTWVAMVGVFSLPGLALAQGEGQTARRHADLVNLACKDLKESCKQFERGSKTELACREANLACKQAEQSARRVAKLQVQEERRAEGVELGIGGSLQEAGEALQGRPAVEERGMLASGKEVRNSLTLNPVALFSGEGVNLTYWRPVSPKVTLVGGARYSRTDIRDNGAMTTFGVTAGADYFVIGQQNEGLRVGPRIDAGVGGQTFGETDVSGSLGLAGEVGYNWIASNGVTAGLSAGLRGRLAGSTLSGDRPSSASFGPYGRLNLGYSW